MRRSILGAGLAVVGIGLTVLLAVRLRSVLATSAAAVLAIVYMWSIVAQIRRARIAKIREHYAVMYKSKGPE